MRAAFQSRQVPGIFQYPRGLVTQGDVVRLLRAGPPCPHPGGRHRPDALLPINLAPLSEPDVRRAQAAVRIIRAHAHLVGG